LVSVSQIVYEKQMFTRMHNQCTFHNLYMSLSGANVLRLKLKHNCDWTLLEHSSAVFSIADPMLIGNAYLMLHTEYNGSRPWWSSVWGTCV